MALQRTLIFTWLLSLSPAVSAAEPRLVSPAPVPPEHAANMAASQTLFQEKIRTFLMDNCLECHGGAKTKSGFDLGSREKLLAGGDRGPAIVLNKGAQSKLVKYVAREEEPHMPPKKPVAKEMIVALSKWIDLGAAYDKPLVATTAVVGKKPLEVTDKDKQYWAYRPLADTTPPAIKTQGWAANPIDSFILAKLEEKQITPASIADRRSLFRRAAFDLTGLPPKAEQVEAFVNDKDANAYEKVVDHLLASDAFGERWARHWLDPARFAESHGFEHDYPRPNAYHYRDFVIRAMNADMPYDQFLKWQVAGDEIEPGNPQALAATGFLGAGVYPTQITNSEAERIRYDAMDDMLSTTGHTFLALTVGCARCHDHKYDPIPTRDYYRLLSAFTTTVRAEIEVDMRSEEEKKKPGSKPIKVKIQATTEGAKPMRHHTADGSIPDFYPNTFILKRGDTLQKDGQANLGFLQVLTRHAEAEKQWTTPLPPGSKTSGKRLALANWMTDTKDGAGSLAARVIVNRLWHHHFGRGIIATVNDFGFQGDPATHPELLEWLAKDFVANGWKLKRLHKLMLMSKTYQLAGTMTESGQKLDPDNRLWHCRPRRRLEAESIRDNLLAVGNILDTKMYGPGSLDSRMTRRSIYFTVRRSQLIPMLQVFDWPDTLTSAAARTTTVVAPQALLFLNNPQVRDCANGLAARIKPAATKSLPDGVHEAYIQAYGRKPAAAELTAGLAYLQSKGADQGKLDAALQSYALVLLSLNEFIYVE